MDSIPAPLQLSSKRKLLLSAVLCDGETLTALILKDRDQRHLHMVSPVIIVKPKHLSCWAKPGRHRFIEKLHQIQAFWVNLLMNTNASVSKNVPEWGRVPGGGGWRAYLRWSYWHWGMAALYIQTLRMLGRLYPATEKNTHIYVFYFNVGVKIRIILVGGNVKMFHNLLV